MRSIRTRVRPAQLGLPNSWSRPRDLSRSFLFQPEFGRQPDLARFHVVAAAQDVLLAFIIVTLSAHVHQLDHVPAPALLGPPLHVARHLIHVAVFTVVVRIARRNDAQALEDALERLAQTGYASRDEADEFFDYGPQSDFDAFGLEIPGAAKRKRIS